MFTTVAASPSPRTTDPSPPQHVSTSAAVRSSSGSDACTRSASSAAVTVLTAAAPAEAGNRVAPRAATCPDRGSRAGLPPLEVPALAIADEARAGPLDEVAERRVAREVRVVLHPSRPVGVRRAQLVGVDGRMQVHLGEPRPD